MNTYNVIFEFRTYISEEIDDLFVQLNFVPAAGTNFYIDKTFIELPKEFGEGAWFKAEDVDYLLKDGAFVVALKDASQYVFKEEKEEK